MLICMATARPAARVGPQLTSGSPLLQALRDLADPAEGVYNATALLGDRLAFIGGMLDKYQNLPSRSAAPTPNVVAGLPVPASTVADEVGIAGRLTGAQPSAPMP